MVDRNLAGRPGMSGCLLRLWVGQNRCEQNVRMRGNSCQHLAIHDPGGGHGQCLRGTNVASETRHWPKPGRFGFDGKQKGHEAKTESKRATQGQRRSGR